MSRTPSPRTPREADCHPVQLAAAPVSDARLGEARGRLPARPAHLASAGREGSLRSELHSLEGHAAGRRLLAHLPDLSSGPEDRVGGLDEGRPPVQGPLPERDHRADTRLGDDHQLPERLQLPRGRRRQPGFAGRDESDRHGIQRVGRHERPEHLAISPADPDRERRLGALRDDPTRPESLLRHAPAVGEEPVLLCPGARPQGHGRRQRRADRRGPG